MKQFQIENLVELFELQLLLLHSQDSDCAGSVNRQPYGAHRPHDTVVIAWHGKVIIRIPFGDFGKSVYPSYYVAGEWWQEGGVAI
jgi:hypothetical protein